MVQATAQAVLTLYTGVISTILSEMFPTNVRYTALSVSYGFAVAIFGGFAPYISTFLVKVNRESAGAELLCHGRGIGQRHRRACSCMSVIPNRHSREETTMTTFVLIHGAYQGGWVWQRVAARLTAAGHTVFAPTLDGCAERRHALRPGISTETHGAEIAELVVLRGSARCGAGGHQQWRHGAVRGRRTSRAIGSRRLVFADALALFDGERIPDIVNRPRR